MPKPNFFIVGAPKCGTTSMYEYLRQHPEVFMSERKEPHFLAPDLEGKWPWGVRDEAAYLALFAKAEGVKRIGEASVWYLHSPSASRRIKEFSPDALIIAMLRNPTDMIYSLHSQYLRSGTEDLHDFGEALAAEEDRRGGRRIPKTTPFPDGLLYRSVPCYTEQVKRYFDLFGRERVLIVVFDDLKADTAGEYRKVTEFLGINLDYTPEFVLANTATAPRRHPFARQVVEHPHLYRVAQATMPLPLRRWIGRCVTRFHRPLPPKPPMDPELRAQLQAHFAPEVEELSRLLDRDLTHWSKPR